MIDRILSNKVKIILLSLALIVFHGEVMSEKLNIVYIEASIGSNWKLEAFADRSKIINLTIEFHDVYNFDKSSRLKEILARDNKPDAIVIQECSVYFPGDFESYKARYGSWIEEIKKHGVQPVIATTVTPASSFGFYRDFKNFIKKHILGRESQFEQIIRFNDWLKEYADSNGITVLDLEKELRISESDRHMRNIYNYGDGIHLNGEAYRVLDLLLKDTINKISSAGQSDSDQ